MKWSSVIKEGENNVVHKDKRYETKLLSKTDPEYSDNNN